MSSPDQTDSTRSPRYGSVENVPHHGSGATGEPPLVPGDDSYSDAASADSDDKETKRGYLNNAAGRLESKANNGDPIVNPEGDHHYAAELYASWLFYHDVASVASGARGSLDADPDDLREYAADFKDEFDTVCSDLRQAGGDESGGNDDGNSNDSSRANARATLL